MTDYDNSNARGDDTIIRHATIQRLAAWYRGLLRRERSPVTLSEKASTLQIACVKRNAPVNDSVEREKECTSYRLSTTRAAICAKYRTTKWKGSN